MIWEPEIQCPICNMPTNSYLYLAIALYVWNSVAEFCVLHLEDVKGIHVVLHCLPDDLQA